MAFNKIETTVLDSYSDELAAELGNLMPHLDPSLDSTPIPRERLSRIIESPFHDQLVATKDGRIVGAATMSTILEPGFEGMAHFGALVTDPESRRQGVGDSVWSAVEEWCTEHGIRVFEFTASHDQTEAHRFFEAQKAEVIGATALFERTIPEDLKPSKEELDARSIVDYSLGQATEIGNLMSHLDPTFSGDPVPKPRLMRIINSPYHDQLAVRRNGRIVGAATMSLLMAPNHDGIGYLGAFVSDPEFRQQGVGGELWQGMEQWGANQGIKTIEFKSEDYRQPAHRLYKAQGAVIVENATLYEHVIPTISRS